MANEAEVKLLDGEGEGRKEANIAPAAPLVKINDNNEQQNNLIDMSAIDEGNQQNREIRVIQINQSTNEGQEAMLMCSIANCDQLSAYQCSVCNTNTCNIHCRRVITLQQGQQQGIPAVYQCIHCVQNQANQVNQAQAQNINRGCCIRRFVLRLFIFFILIIIASVYASNSDYN